MIKTVSYEEMIRQVAKMTLDRAEVMLIPRKETLYLFGESTVERHGDPSAFISPGGHRDD